MIHKTNEIKDVQKLLKNLLVSDYWTFIKCINYLENQIELVATKELSNHPFLTVFKSNTQIILSDTY